MAIDERKFLSDMAKCRREQPKRWRRVWAAARREMIRERGKEAAARHFDRLKRDLDAVDREEGKGATT